MRILRINNQLVDIDDKTAIGIDLQTYDVKDPANRKINITNSFNIPITNNNLQIIGRIGGPQNTETSVYDEMICDYWVDNYQYITKAKVRVQIVIDDLQEREGKGRIELLTFEKPNIWDLLKQEKWGDFVENYFNWLTIPKFGSPYTGTWDSFISPYLASGGSNGLFIPYLKGNSLEAALNMQIGVNSDNIIHSSGSHICTFVKTIFEYIEDTYSVNFGTAETFDYNIWNDVVAQDMYILHRDITTGVIDSNNFYFSLNKSTITEDYIYIGYGQADESRDKSLYDFVLSFIQQFQLIITPNVNGDNFKLRRFDDLQNVEVAEFSGNFTGKPKFIPFVEGFNQKNYIINEAVAPGLNENTNMRVITCLNKNIDEETELFKISNYLPSFTDENGSISELIPYYGDVESFKTFKFLINSGNTIPESITVSSVNNAGGGTTVSTSKTNLIAPALYDLNSEYILFDNALNYPKYYEHTKWVTALDLRNFDFYKQYWIRELNGSFFVNKIKGFNPDKSKQATTFELLKISDQKPAAPIAPLPQSEYGRLYNYYALSGLAPSGMRVPLRTDYNTLAGAIVDGGDLKEAGLVHWNSPNTGADNSSGFTAFGGGVRYDDGTFANFKNQGIFYIDEDNGSLAYTRLLVYINTNFNESLDTFKTGYSVRMVSDVNPGATVTDFEGRVYDVVQIGSQYWTVQNWACSTLNDGTPIPNVTDNTAWSNLTTAGQCAYNNDNNLIPI